MNQITMNPCIPPTISRSHFEIMKWNQKTALIFFSAIFLQITGCGALSDTKSDRETLNNFLKPVNSIDLKTVENAVNRLLIQNKEALSSSDRLQIAAYFDKIEDPNRAIEQLEKIQGEDKLASLARLNEGRLHFIRTRLASKAEVSLKKSVAIDPKQTEAWALLASIYDIQNRLPERDQCYAKLDELSSLNRDQLIHWTCRRRPDAGIREIGELLGAFVKADPTDSISALALADHLRLQGDFESASKLTEKVLENQSDNTILISSQILNAEIAWDRGDLNLTEKILSEAKAKMEIKHDATLQSRFYRISSLIQISRKSYQRAESDLNQALKNKPLDREINQLIVQVQRFQKQPELARKYESQLNQIDRLEDLAQKSTASLYRDDKLWLEKIADIAAQSGRDQVAMAWLRQILVKDPLNSEIQKKIYQIGERLKERRS